MDYGNRSFTPYTYIILCPSDLSTVITNKSQLSLLCIFTNSPADGDTALSAAYLSDIYCVAGVYRLVTIAVVCSEIGCAVAYAVACVVERITHGIEIQKETVK